MHEVVNLGYLRIRNEVVLMKTYCPADIVKEKKKEFAEASELLMNCLNQIPSMVNHRLQGQLSMS